MRQTPEEMFLQHGVSSVRSFIVRRPQSWNCIPRAAIYQTKASENGDTPFALDQQARGVFKDFAERVAKLPS